MGQDEQQVRGRPQHGTRSAPRGTCIECGKKNTRLVRSAEWFALYCPRCYQKHYMQAKRESLKALAQGKRARKKTHKNWTDQERDALTTDWTGLSWQDLLEKYERTKGSLKNEARMLGLPRRPYFLEQPQRECEDAQKHHNALIAQYFPDARRSQNEDIQGLLQLLQDGIVAMVQRINASRQTAKDLRR